MFTMVEASFFPNAADRVPLATKFGIAVPPGFANPVFAVPFSIGDFFKLRLPER